MSSEMIPLCVPQIAGDEWRYVKDCLDTGWVSSAGPYVDNFERAFASAAGSPRAVAVATGTAALHLALLVSGVSADDEVIMPPLTFIAPANAVRYVGAWPVFVGVDSRYWQLDPERLEAFLTEAGQIRNGRLINRHSGRRIAAILPVHVLGHPCDMDAIIAIANKFNLPVIEDATESLGSLYKGRSPGTFGTVGCFSFNGNKIVTSGGGGMVVTADQTLAARAKYLSQQAKDGEEFIHGEVGYNYRLTNLQAAFGLAQLEQLDAFVAAKRRIAQRYNEGFADIPGVSPMLQAPWAESSWWMYTILVEPELYGVDCIRLSRELSAGQIQTRRLWEPLHRSRPYADCMRVACEEADRLYGLALSLPCSTGLTSAQQDRVIDAVRRAGKHNQLRVG